MLQLCPFCPPNLQWSSIRSRGYPFRRPPFRQLEFSIRSCPTLCCLPYQRQTSILLGAFHLPHCPDHFCWRAPGLRYLESWQGARTTLVCRHHQRCLDDHPVVLLCRLIRTYQVARLRSMSKQDPDGLRVQDRRKSLVKRLLLSTLPSFQALWNLNARSCSNELRVFCGRLVRSFTLVHYQFGMQH